jgi:hypothetical protein
MVHIEESSKSQKIKIKVLDKFPNSTQKRYSILIRPSYTVKELVHDISIQYQYKGFDLFLQGSGESGKSVSIFVKFSTILNEKNCF